MNRQIRQSGNSNCLVTLLFATFVSILQVQSAPAQPVWSDIIDPASVILTTRAWGSCTCSPGGGGYDTGPLGASFGAGVLADYFWSSFARGQTGTPPCWCMSLADGLVTVDGVGTNTLVIRAAGVANANHDCVGGYQCEGGQCVCPSTYRTGAYSIISMLMLLLVEGVEPGADLTVSYRWNQTSQNMFRPEAGTDDISKVLGDPADTDAAVGPVPLFDGLFDLDDQRGRKSGGASGSFDLSAGTPIVVKYDMGMVVLMRGPARGSQHPCLEYDSESVASGFELVLVLGEEDGSGMPPPLPPDDCPDPDLFFALRIGSESELSNHLSPEGGLMDPGDGYLWDSPPLPPGGADGALDDTLWFGFDPMPDPPDPAHGTAAPSCTFIPLDPAAYFELDALDQIDFSLAGIVGPAPLAAPLTRSFLPSSCIFELENLAISYADKGSGNYVACDVPIVTPTPLGGTYGSTEDRDEVLGLLVLPGPIGPGLPPLAAAEYPLADEAMLHPTLAPNPPSTPIFGPPVPQFDDDDVGALSAIPAPEAGTPCGVTLVSVSHEAAGSTPGGVGGVGGVGGPAVPLDPGVIYEEIGGALVPVIDESVHLGVPESTDIDALEMVWLPDTLTGEYYLAALFSVDDDEIPGSAIESGGLNPRFIYYSFLTGTYGVLIDSTRDNVDALTNYCSPISIDADTPIPGGCETIAGDMDGSGDVNGKDVGGLVACMLGAGPCPCGDLDCDADVDVDDAGIFVTMALTGAAGPDCGTGMEPVGSCCDANIDIGGGAGLCTDGVAEAYCLAPGMSWSIAPCSEVPPCPVEYAACCLPSGACSVTTPGACAGAGGAWRPGTDCSTTCPVSICTSAARCQLPDVSFGVQRGGYVSDADNGISVADDFRPVNTPGSNFVNQVCWRGFHRSGTGDCSSLGETESFSITIYASAGTLPATGVVVGGPFVVTPLKGVPTPAESVVGGGVQYRYEATLPAAVAVAAGACYWIEIQQTDADPDCVFLWSTSNEGGNRKAAIQSTGAAPFTYQLLDRDLAVCIGPVNVVSASCAFTPPAPANNACAAAIALGVGPVGPIAGTTIGATLDPGASGSCSSAIAADVYYTWTQGPIALATTFDLGALNTTFDAVLSVHNTAGLPGGGCPATTAIESEISPIFGCNDDGAPTGLGSNVLFFQGRQPRLVITASDAAELLPADNTFLVRVSGAAKGGPAGNAPNGAFLLEVTQP